MGSANGKLLRGIGGRQIVPSSLLRDASETSWLKMTPRSCVRAARSALDPGPVQSSPQWPLSAVVSSAVCTSRPRRRLGLKPLWARIKFSARGIVSIPWPTSSTMRAIAAVNLTPAVAWLSTAALRSSPISSKYSSRRPEARRLTLLTTNSGATTSRRQSTSRRLSHGHMLPMRASLSPSDVAVSCSVNKAACRS